tara:strand:- start:108 stop:623 length:516 start_codon:yes stop_codon:yes gene_type:complete
MGGGVSKKILSEIHLIYGNVLMPKGFEINTNKLINDTLTSIIKKLNFSFSKNWDMLNTYIIDHVFVEHNINLFNKQTWGNIYKPNEVSIPLLNINPIDLKNSPDYTCLYGTKVKECMVRINFEDNRRKGKSFDIELTNNKFIIFPSTCMYYLTNTQKDSLNFVQTITYEYI